MSRLFYAPRVMGGLLVVLLLGSGLFWGKLIREEQAAARGVTDRLDDEKLALRRLEMEQGKVEGVMNRYRHNLQEIQRFRSHFQENKDERLVQISKFLDEATRNRGVSKKRIDYTTGKAKEKDLQVYKIQMPLTGRYRDIRALIGDIETSNLFLVISEITLEDADERGTVMVQLVLETYFQEGEGHE